MLSVLLRRVCRIRGNGEVIKREEFDQRKAAAEAARLARLQRKPQKLASQGKHVGDCPLLQVKTTGCACKCAAASPGGAAFAEEIAKQQAPATLIAWCTIMPAAGCAELSVIDNSHRQLHMRSAAARGGVLLATCC